MSRIHCESERPINKIPKCSLLSWGQLLLAQSHRLREALSWRNREAWADWKDIRVALAALEGSGYFKAESEDGEAKTKKLVWSVCLDPERITALDGLSARKMPATTWVSILKRLTRHLLRQARQQVPQVSKTSTQRL